MKRTPPASVSGEGAAGCIEPVQKVHEFPMPKNWPAHRVPTPAEQARIQAAIERREQLTKDIWHA